MGVLVFILPLLFASAFAGLIQSDEKCGLQDKKADPSGRLSGADGTDYGEFPWMAALRYKISNSGLNGGIKCGGFVINRRFVLTAAHCLHIDEMELEEILLGVRKITEIDTTDADKVRRFRVAKKIPHENYNVYTGDNDIALLKLNEDIGYTDYIRSICLPKAAAALPPSKTVLTVAGWGAYKSGGSQSDWKLKVDVPMYDHTDCAKLGLPDLKSEQFCAEGEITKGTCWGDGGGPLMRAVESGIGDVWTAIGIISGVSGCGLHGKPVIHTRVSMYVEWINQNVARA